jgi:hypothetical protein
VKNSKSIPFRVSKTNRSSRQFLIPGFVFILSFLGIFGYWIYHSTYVEWGYSEIKLVLQNHELDLLNFKKRLLDLHSDPIFLGIGKVEYIGSKNYTRSDYSYYTKQDTPGTDEFFLESLINELYKSKITSVRSRTGKGFSFGYEGSYDDHYALVFCENPNPNICFDAYYSKVVSSKPLKQYWWYVHGIFRDDWYK